MKRIGLFAGLFFAACIFQSCSNKKEEKATGLPGDNLDLYAVLDLFKSSKSVEGFERSLNDKSSGVNNLDLNGDGKVDYIRVIDQRDGDDHAITLRTPVSKTESQDVAVIEIEKTGDKKAGIQVIGDEDLYGKNMIIEPKEKSNEAGFAFVYATTEVAVNVWYWPSVTYIYSPGYVVWMSPYEYDYYPVYWDPWEPIAYEVYYPVVYVSHSNYVIFDQPRFRHANEIYYTNHVRSNIVIERQRKGDFRGGKQGRYKENNLPGGNGGNDKGNKSWNDGRGGSNAREDHRGNPAVNERKGNTPMGGGNKNENPNSARENRKGNVPVNGGNQNRGTNAGNEKKNPNMGNENKNPNTGHENRQGNQKVQTPSPRGNNYPKAPAPKGNNQPPRGGGGSHKGGGGKHG